MYSIFEYYEEIDLLIDFWCFSNI